jgi:outer membrane lipoprotein-sorting protein
MGGSKMKKIISLLLIVAIMLGCISLVGCRGGEGGVAKMPSGEEASSEETLGDILARGEGIEAVKYDIVMTAPGEEAVTQKIWVKQNKMRMEFTAEGQATILLIDCDAHTGYAYMPEQNIAYKAVFNPTIQSASDQAQSIADYDYNVVGTETIDGKACLVVEYTYSQAEESLTVKEWIWKERGFPVRMETTTSEGTVTAEYKNIEFVDISDDMFQLPAGVQIVEMGQSGT